MVLHIIWEHLEKGLFIFITMTNVSPIYNISVRDVASIFDVWMYGLHPVKRASQQSLWRHYRWESSPHLIHTHACVFM